MPTYAFIDSQNLYRAVTEIGEKIDYRRFRLWLTNKYKIDRAFMYFGHMEKNQGLYNHLKRCKFELMFRDVEHHEGRVKANVDIFLTIDVLEKLNDFNNAFIVTSDGDFFDLTEKLKREGKFGGVISPAASSHCSSLLKTSCGGRVIYIPDIIHKFRL